MKEFNITFFLSVVALSSTMILTSCSGDNDDITASPSSVNIADGHEYVDLGLSVKWATCNVGAKNPWEYGDYFAWGETQSKNKYNWSNNKWCNLTEDHHYRIKKYNTYSGAYGTFDKKNILDASDDAAYVNWGGKWRIPTKAEMQELQENCYIVPTSNYNGKGVTGLIFFKAKAEADKGRRCEENYITPSSTYSLSDDHVFFPGGDFLAAGGFDEYSYRGGINYWSSSLAESQPELAWAFNGFCYADLRCLGLLVRPVRP